MPDKVLNRPLQFVGPESLKFVENLVCANNYAFWLEINFPDFFTFCSYFSLIYPFFNFLSNMLAIHSFQWYRTCKNLISLDFIMSLRYSLKTCWFILLYACFQNSWRLFRIIINWNCKSAKNETNETNVKKRLVYSIFYYNARSSYIYRMLLSVEVKIQANM